MNTNTKTEAISYSQVASRVGWIGTFTVLTALGAWIKIPLPFTPVPITLTTATVLASGVVIGRDGIYAMLLYVLLGGLGVPMFAGSDAGFRYLLGATGGYIFGYIAVAALSARFVRPYWKTGSYLGRVARLFWVSLFVFVPGVIQLKFVTGMTWTASLMAGFVPFIIGDGIKVLAVSALPNRALRNQHP